MQRDFLKNINQSQTVTERKSYLNPSCLYYKPIGETDGNVTLDGVDRSTFLGGSHAGRNRHG